MEMNADCYEMCGWKRDTGEMTDYMDEAVFAAYWNSHNATDGGGR